MAQKNAKTVCKSSILGSNCTTSEPVDLGFQSYKETCWEKLRSIEKRIKQISSMSQEEYDELASQISKDWRNHRYNVENKQLKWGWNNFKGYISFINKVSQKYHDLAAKANEEAKAAGLEAKLLLR